MSKSDSRSTEGITDRYQWPGLILSSSTTKLLMEATFFHLRLLSKYAGYPACEKPQIKVLTSPGRPSVMNIIFVLCAWKIVQLKEK